MEVTCTASTVQVEATPGDGSNYSLNYYGTYWSSTYTSSGDVMQRTLSSGSNQLNRAEYWV